MILINFFALQHNIFPATGAVSFSSDPAQALWHAFLPAVALQRGVAEIVRQLRSALLEILSSQHVRALYAKGLSPSAILWRHALSRMSAPRYSR